MHQHKFLRGLKILIFGLVVATVLGFVVRGLWNELVPSIFGWRLITFWQALGLLLLCKILFGGFHRYGGGYRGQWRRQMKERWEHMTPEEREKFRKGMRCGRGPWAPPAEPQV